eukprot:TRINITY_DN1634_c0_g1_i4.p2 TRINITY_DN1634_c0_g1~~TRINITY_DN1634_c0_g1_i4.p2  ORF type:complete len:287 (-),score=38.27 TRINITY_DN1634_c0_g1_i4:500-1360(-)
MTVFTTVHFFFFLTVVVGELKVGLMGPELTENLAYIANLTQDGQCMPSYECDILNAICEALQEDCKIVFMYDFKDRTDKVANGEVDITIAQTKVTPENAELVHFIRPFYYYVGAAIFIPQTLPVTDHPVWEDLQGQRVCLAEDFYAAEAIKFRFGAELVEANLPDFVARGIAPWQIFEEYNCNYVISDSTHTVPKVVQSMNALVEFGSPLGIAIAHEKRDTLGADISKVLVGLMSKGKDSAILDMEKRSFGAVGVPSNIKLRDIVQAITDFNGTLPAAVEDAIWDE